MGGSSDISPRRHGEHGGDGDQRKYLITTKGTKMSFKMIYFVVFVTLWLGNSTALRGDVCVSRGSAFSSWI